MLKLVSDFVVTANRMRGEDHVQGNEKKETVIIK
jgi:hypothetical protein